MNSEDINEKIQNEPTLEEVKKVVDKKRATKEDKRKTKTKPIIPIIEPQPKNKSEENLNNDILNQLKELILNQNQILNNLNVKPARKPREKKPVVEKKTLDLTITDTDIKNIMDNNNIHNNKNENHIKNEQVIDAKLQAFLQAFKKF
jgi:hypothetical protein